jgi:glycosyltransferase involved in cell wall biosynthesis
MKKERAKIVVVIAAYNEEERIGRVIDQVAKYCDKVIVVDDGSIDNTYKAVKNKKACVLRHKINLGQGAALQTGFDYAKELNPIVVVTFDADGQFDASEIPLVIKPVLNGEVDVVLGSRFLGNAKNIGLIRKLVLKAGVLFTYIFSEIQLTDTHNGFRALSKKALYSIRITQNRMAHASEIIDQVVINDLKYVELPVTVEYDAYSKSRGQNSLNALTIVFRLILNKLY